MTWHYVYTATIEITHNPAHAADSKQMGHDLERKIEEITLSGGFKVKKARVEFRPTSDDEHLS